MPEIGYSKRELIELFQRESGLVFEKIKMLDRPKNEWQEIIAIIDSIQNGILHAVAANNQRIEEQLRQRGLL